MLLPRLNFENKYDFRLKQDKGKYFIYDDLRRKWILLTGEEWVRQHWIKHFIERGSSRSQLVAEKKITLNHTTKRVDLMVLSKTGVEYLIECKAPSVRVNQKHFEQVARYNLSIRADKIIISNGLEHFVARFKSESYSFDSLQLS